MATRTLGIILLVSMAISSCGKYEDGPILSFRAKKVRLANTWIYQSITYVNQSITVTENLPDIEMTFTEDGNYSDTYNRQGNWDFSGEVSLRVTFTNLTDSLINWEILRLASKELWLKIDGNEHHFIPR